MFVVMYLTDGLHSISFPLINMRRYSNKAPLMQIALGPKQMKGKEKQRRYKKETENKKKGNDKKL